MYFRCAPDWHSNHRDNSYIWFILVLGFLIPTVIIILSSLLTCANIREVRFYFLIIQSFYIVCIIKFQFSFIYQENQKNLSLNHRVNSIGLVNIFQPLQYCIYMNIIYKHFTSYPLRVKTSLFLRDFYMYFINACKRKHPLSMNAGLSCLQMTLESMTGRA